jgi:solute carrier family 25 (mitochondrial phosphate transporter), member 3
MSSSKAPSTGINTSQWLLAKDPQTGLGPLGFYTRCMVGGFLACGVTHASVVTLDVAKVRSQAHGSSGKWPKGLIPSVQKTWQAEGVAGVTKGWVPTFWGYGAQGLFKFGLNEFFKDYFTHAIGGPDKLDSTPKKMLLWAVASGSAEVVADVFLCPFEMTKV